MIAVIDYDVGNLFSIRSSLAYLNYEPVIAQTKEQLASASHIILPGVGAFGDAMNKLKNTGMIDTLYRRIDAGVPVLGICLGMQLLFERSFEYGVFEGLSILKGEVRPLKEDIKALSAPAKIPHMGWNNLDTLRECPIFSRGEKQRYVYYIHSYYAKHIRDSDLVATSGHGVKIPGIVQKDNVFGCQFHPEKSGNTGLNILRLFCEL